MIQAKKFMESSASAGAETLPKRLLEQLEAWCHGPVDILCAAVTDMNRLGEFAPGYLILTPDALITAEATRGQYYTELSGQSFFARQHRRESDVAAYAFFRCPFEDVEQFCVSVQIRTCTLYYKARRGVDRQIAVYTAGRYQAVQEVIKRAQQLMGARDGQQAGEEPKRAGAPGRGADMPPEDGAHLVFGAGAEATKRRSVMLRMMSYFRPYVLLMALLLLTYLASAGLNLLWPYLNGTILYDRILAKNEEVLSFLHLPAGRFAAALLLVVCAMVLTKLTMLGFEVLQGAVLAKLVPMVVLSIKNQIFKSMGELSLSFFQSSQTGSLMTRVLSDADLVVDFFATWLPNILTDSFTLVSTCIIMFVLDWRLALASWVLLPLLAFITVKLRSRLHTLFGRRHRSERSLRSKLNDNITGVRVVKAFGQERREVGRFQGTNENVRDAELSIVRYNNLFSALYTLVQEAVTLLVWAVGAYFVLVRGDITYGLLITFAGYVAQLQQPLRDFSQMFRSFTECINASERVFEVLDAKPQITEAEHPVRMRDQKGSVSLSHVTFGYEPNSPVIHDMSLTVPAGGTLGIVGRSGAGKSTLVNLISRLYEVQEGSIQIDGVDIREMSFQDLRRNVAMVSQDTYIFMGTVAENIAYANPQAGKEDIIRAAKLASAHDFICKMPEGYDTVIGASGRSLSGGERQRISIARAILADPKILILDEATASVDTETEKQIQASIQYLSRDRTTLSIAHRLSTLRDADHLIVIEQGRIVEEGTHQELIDKKGTFYLLMELQTKALAMRGLTDEVKKGER